MAAIAARAPSCTDHRRRVLDRYLDQLRSGISTGSDPGKAPVRLANGRGGVVAEAWVSEQLQTFCRAGAQADPRAELVAQVVAAMAKIDSDRGVLRETTDLSGQKLHVAQAELMLGTAIGMALLREVQEAVHEAIRCGDGALARQYTGLSHELRKAVEDTEHFLAGAERERAAALSDSLTDRPRLETEASDRERVAPIGLNEPDRRRWRRVLGLDKRKDDTPWWLPSRTELLVIALALTVTFWGAIFELPRRVHRAPHRLTLADFASIEELESVVAKPPSLYVTVNAEAWAALTDGERKSLVHRASGVVDASGYSGILFRTPDGTTVAQWFELRGLQLNDPEEATAPQPAYGETDPRQFFPGRR